VDIIQLFFPVFQGNGYRHFLTSNASASSTILCHKLVDDWIALEQGKVNRAHTNSWLECDPLLRRNITSVGVRVLFQNL